MTSEHFDSLFEIMNPTSRGIERLFKEDDRFMLKSITDQIKDHLEDFTAESNDMRFGYINGANTINVFENDWNVESGVIIAGNTKTKVAIQIG